VSSQPVARRSDTRYSSPPPLGFIRRGTPRRCSYQPVAGSEPRPSSLGMKNETGPGAGDSQPNRPHTLHQRFRRKPSRSAPEIRSWRPTLLARSSPLSIKAYTVALDTWSTAATSAGVRNLSRGRRTGAGPGVIASGFRDTPCDPARWPGPVISVGWTPMDPVRSRVKPRVAVGVQVVAGSNPVAPTTRSTEAPGFAGESHGPGASFCGRVTSKISSGDRQVTGALLPPLHPGVDRLAQHLARVDAPGLPLHDAAGGLGPERLEPRRPLPDLVPRAAGGRAAW